MRYLVTGCAGFVGSHLCERLLADGHDVLGVDAFTDYYPRDYKERNLCAARNMPNFTFVEGDLVSMNLGALVQGVDVVFHQAAQAGVRASWGNQFDLYTRHNILATQRLLEACRAQSGLTRFVYASSSSIYGNARALPVSEDAMPQPVSPYGVTKLAAEHLCVLYWANFDVPIVALRYFTVYGARQRPDMAFHRFIRAAFEEEPITVHEDGNQTRDFTHVGDIVEANLLASRRTEAVGNVYNIAGGSRVTLNHALDRLAEISGRELRVLPAPRQAGDVRDTYADISRARQDLGYEPSVHLDAGLRDEITWFERYHAAPSQGHQAETIS